jgi:hypothetical protein
MNELEMPGKTEKVGASRSQIENAIEHFKLMQEQINGNEYRKTSYQTVLAELRDMAAGGSAWPIEDTIEHEGGVDEKGTYDSYTELYDEWNLRRDQYKGWKDEDFAEVLQAIGEPLKKSE